MKRIQKVTADAFQKQTFVLDSGDVFEITLYYRPNQLGWFIWELVFGDFVLNNVRVCVSPNLLYQYQNKLPFGIACFSTDGREPTLQEDFESGAAKLYVLSPAEVAEYSAYVRA